MKLYKSVGVDLIVFNFHAHFVPSGKFVFYKFPSFFFNKTLIALKLKLNMLQFLVPGYFSAKSLISV
jgi:hypothetical protein